ncbi:hypothetical protein Unana1_07117 [Umbelopsis nana]
MDTREKEFRTDAVEDKSPDNTVADNDKNYMFPPVEVGIPLTKLQWALTFIGLSLSLFLAAVDTTIVSTAIPKIGSDFEALEKASWIATAYILSFDSFQPMYGKLSDIFGRKNVLLAAVFIFLLGSVLCGVSTNMIMIIVMRALQGVGGAGIFSIVFITVADMIPLRARGQYSALISTCTHGQTFFINLPVGGVGCLLLIVFLKEKRKPAPIRQQLKRIDYLGTITILAFATLVLVALNMGGVQYPWKSAPVLVCLIVGVVFMAVLVVVELRFAKEPMIPMHLFKKRTVLSICVTNLFFGAAFIPLIIELPLYLQAARGDSATMSGVRVIVGQASICVVSALTGYAMGTLNSYKPFLIAGTALSTLGIGLLSMLNDAMPFGQLYGFIIIAGAGAGMIYACSSVAAQSACEPKDLAVVTVLVTFVSNLGSAMGIAIAAAVINNGLSSCLSQSIAVDLVVLILQSSTFIRSGALSPEEIDITVKCYNFSFRTMFLVMTGLNVVAFISTLFIKQHSLMGHQPPKEDVVFEKDNSSIDIEKQQLEKEDANTAVENEE